MFNKNKKSLILPILVISLAIGFLFHEKITIGPLSLSSLSSVNQILSSYNDEQRLRSMSLAELNQLTTDINSEISSINIDTQPLRTSLQTLRNQQSVLQAVVTSARQAESAVSLQISRQRLVILPIESNISRITNQYNNELVRCRKMKVLAQKNTCLTRAESIKSPLAKYRTDLTTANSLLSTLNTNLTTAKRATKTANDAVVPKTREIDIQTQSISAYESQISQLGALLNLIEEIKRRDDVYGCRDYGAVNFNVDATIDDGSCEYHMPQYDIWGCMDPRALNYDSTANQNNTNCIYEEEERTDMCLCSPEVSAEVEKPTQVSVNITTFGGPNDPHMDYDETLSVATTTLARNLIPTNLYTAWPLSDPSGGGFKSRLDLPNVEKCFGPENNSWPSGTGDERIAAANRSLADYWAEITYIDSNGNKTTVGRIEVVDRGPHNAGRWDASLGVWRALGLEHMVGKDSHPDTDPKVTLEVRLVPKDGTCTSYSN